MKFLRKLFSEPIDQKWTKAKNNCWKVVKKSCTGYDNVTITAHKKPEHSPSKLISYPLIANLMRLAADNNNHLKVLDFGGSNGGSYRDIKNFYPAIKFEWDIVEQKNIVDSCKNFLDEEVSIMSEIPNNKKYDVVIISAVLHYLDDYKPYLERLLSLDASHIIVDRTIVFASSKNKEPILAIQHNPSSFHGKSVTYPCWILNENKIFEQIEKKYSLVNRFFSSLDRMNKVANIRVACVGGIFKKL